MDKYTGIRVIEFDDWQTWFEKGEVTPDKKLKLVPNQGIVLKGNDCKQHGVYKEDINKIVAVKHYAPCGIAPKNTEQTLALEMLRDPSINMVTLLGVAGSGKTLLACAHALHEFKKGNYAKIVIAKSLTPVGREVGFLKGSLFEKIIPWLGPFRDNFLLCDTPYYVMEKMIENEELEVSPITFIQGRSISNAIIIIDEAQNLEAEVLKQIVSRAGEGTKVVLLGDPTQVFEKLKNPGLEHIVEKSKDSRFIAHITMRKSLRSRLAQWAVDNL